MFHAIIVVYTTIVQTDLLSLPFWLHRGTAFVTFAFAIFMIAARAVIAAIGGAAQLAVAENQNCRPVYRRCIPRLMVCDRDYRWRWIELPYSTGIAPGH